MNLPAITPDALFIADWIIRISLSVHVILRRRSAAVTLSWLAVILLIPFVGAILYFMVGENHLGRRRARRAAALRHTYQPVVEQITHCPADRSDNHPAQYEHLLRQVRRAIGFPALTGNDLQLIDHAYQFFQRLIADIDQAQSSIDLLFYIWHAGGRADHVADALIRARQRGVTCRVLVDAVGSRDFLRSDTAERLRRADVAVRAALPVGLFRMIFVRLDLRNHRKLVIIDNQLAYTGSQNMADPRLFKRSSNVGQWIDTMVRIQGPAVLPLQMIFFQDWQLETNEDLTERLDTSLLSRKPDRHMSLVQVLPSGPGEAPDAIHNMLISSIYAARKELIMTSPYFVPDEEMVNAMTCAAHSGVDVTIVVPRRLDHPMVRLASRSYYETLLEAGVKIYRFKDGLLHAKTICIDSDLALVGSVNLDMRSFWLNFEITLCVYDPGFARQLRLTQKQYIAHATPIQLQEWRKRSTVARFAENTAQLFGPLL